MLFLTKFFTLLYVTFFSIKAHAIVVLPAIILIPLVKLVAFIVATFSIPIAGGGIVLAKITQKRKLVFFICLILLVVIGIVSAIILRKTHPVNPWF